MWEHSIGKLGNQKGRWPRVRYKREKKRLGKREAVRDITPLLMSFRCQCHRQQQHSGRIQSWDERGKPCNLQTHCRSRGDEDSQYHHGHSISSDSNIQGSDSLQYCGLSFHTSCTSCCCLCPMCEGHNHGWRFEPDGLSCPWSRGLCACRSRCGYYNPVLPPFYFLFHLTFSVMWPSCHMVHHMTSHLTFITWPRHCSDRSIVHSHCLPC